MHSLARYVSVHTCTLIMYLYTLVYAVHLQVMPWIHCTRSAHYAQLHSILLWTGGITLVSVMMPRCRHVDAEFCIPVIM